MTTADNPRVGTVATCRRNVAVRRADGRHDVAAGRIPRHARARNIRTSTSTCGACGGSPTRSRRRRSHIFDGNIFHPEPRTLTYSDAMIVEGLVGAPLLWVGLPPMLVHNLLLLGAIVASAVGMFVLVQMLTGSHCGRHSRRHCLCVRAVSLRALHAHGAAMDDVDAVVVLGAAPDAGDTVVAKRPAHRACSSRCRCCRASTTACFWHAARRLRRSCC